MKEYILKKWYPGLPVEWKKEERVIMVDNKDHLMSPHPSLDIRYYAIIEEEIKNNTEYWKEIKPKEYEVLKLVRNQITSTLRENGRYTNENYEGKGYYTLEQNVEMGYKISSVKRISDGEVFSLGDTLDSSITDSILVIKEIEINELYVGGIALFEDELNVISLGFAQKAPAFKFTTDDGVVVRDENKILFGVYPKYSWHTSQLIAKEWDTNPILNNYKVFSSDKKRYSYIVSNKPVLSYNDLTFNLSYVERLDLIEKIEKKLTEDGIR